MPQRCSHWAESKAEDFKVCEIKYCSLPPLLH
jgi:hypothetical protein